LSAYNNGSASAVSHGTQQTKKLWLGGATGFLGTHLVRVLRAQGHELVLASRSGGDVDGYPK